MIKVEVDGKSEWRRYSRQQKSHRIGVSHHENLEADFIPETRGGERLLYKVGSPAPRIISAIR